MMHADVFAGFGQEAEAFTFVGNALCTEKQQFFVRRQIVAHACRLLVHRLENVGINGIGDIGDGVGQIGHPAAATHESDVPALIHRQLAVKDVARQVLAHALQHRALLALRLILLAPARIMADACEIPLVMQRHHHGLAAGKDAVEIFE